MEWGLFLALFIMNVATVTVVGFIFHGVMTRKIRTLMEKERKKYFDIIQDSIYVAMENERKVKEQIAVFDNAVKTADDRLKAFGNLRDAAESVRDRQCELEERLASMLMQMNDLAGKIDGQRSWGTGTSQSSQSPQGYQGSHAIHPPQGLNNQQAQQAQQASPFHQAPQNYSAYQGYDPRPGSGQISGNPGFSGPFISQPQSLSGLQGNEGFGRIAGTLEMAVKGIDLGDLDLRSGYKDLRDEYVGHMNRSIRENSGDILGNLDEVDQILGDEDPDDDEEIDISEVIKRINDRVGSHPGIDPKRFITEPAQESKAESEKRCRKIVDLAAKGFSPGNIARELDIPLGEVQIILRLKRHLPGPDSTRLTLEE